jgi:signal transduction histidine kinase
MAAALLFAIAVLGAGYTALVLRAAPTRRDNRLFAVIGGLDVAMVAWRGFVVASGGDVIDPAVMVPCSMGATVLAVTAIQFLWSFPGHALPRMAAHIGLGAWSLLTSLAILLTPRDSVWLEIVSWGFFIPADLVIFAVGVRAWRRTATLGVRLVVGAILFRFGFGVLAYMFGERLGGLRTLLWIETTAATLTSFVVIGHGVLRDQLFRVRGAVAEAVGSSLSAVMVLGATAAAVHGALRLSGAAREVALIAATMVPLGLIALGRAIRLETRVLAGLDARRALRLELTEPLPDDPERAIEVAVERLGAMTAGGAVRWWPVAELPAAIRAALAEHRELGAGAEALAPALTPAFGDLVVGGRAGDALLGAWALTGGLIDRDTLLVARATATEIARAVAQRAVKDELEGARRLAALGQFAAAIAHDIRTPLTSVSMNLQILRRQSALPPDEMEYVDIALGEVGRLDRAVGEILAYAKPVQLDADLVDLRELVDDTARSLGPVIGARGVTLACEHALDTPAIIGDAQRLRQVLVNLIDNAAAASGDGDRVVVRTRRDAAGPAARAVIEVEDRGRGIAAADLARVFEPFYTTRPDGTGLGLAICQKLVRAHHGELRVQSTLGAGSYFAVVLPVVAHAAHEAARETLPG